MKMKNILFLILINFSCLTVEKSKQIIIKDGFRELSPGIYYFINENDNYFEMYKQNGYTLEKYISKNIQAVVENFLNSAFEGDLNKLNEYIGNETISEFEERCRKYGIIRNNQNEYLNLLFSDLKTRKKTCNNSGYFSLHNIFKIKKEQIFKFDGKRYFFLVWLNPTYEEDKFYLDENFKTSKIGLPWEGNVEHGSDFVIYYLNQNFIEVGVYGFTFNSKKKATA
ncbi:hypothetical protein [Leptospira bandrabouensis]|nr:hypothetical protein [Leptospira bandrabouensis]